MSAAAATSLSVRQHYQQREETSAIIPRYNRPRPIARNNNPVSSIQQALGKVEGEAALAYKSQKIKLVGTSIPREDFLLLIQTLKQQPTVKSVEICLCSLEENDILAFASDMQNFNLHALQLVHVGLSANAASALAIAVQECSLKRLDLAFNRIGPSGATDLASALKDCGLEVLLISRNEIRAEGAIKIAQALEEGHTSLRHLDLTKNSIGDDGCEAIAKALPHTILETLQLDTNGITIRGVTALCETLPKCPSLLHLSLGGNLLSDDSVNLLAQVLPKTNIEKLTLDASDFGDIGLSALGEAIALSNTLVTLELKQNRKVKDSGIMLLLEKVKAHRSFTSILLDQTAVTQPVRDYTAARLARFHSKSAMLMVALCAAKMIPKIGAKSTFKLPMDMMRLLASTLA